MIMAVSHNRAREAVVTVLTFAVLGPPIGAITLSAVLPIFIAITSLQGHAEPVANRLVAALGMMPVAVVASYASGVVQAGMAGMLVAAHRAFAGKPNLGWLTGYASVVWAGYMLLGPSRDALEMALLWPVHAVPTCACAWLAARLWKN